MKRKLRLVWLLPALVFIASAGFVLFSHQRAHDTDVITLRFAHWNLQAGLREGYETLARHYEALHPGIRIEQVPVPVRTWYSWQQTQLVGGTPPDIIQLSRITQDEMIARYFVPLGEAAHESNPYNTGSPLAGLPWRDTFFDGLNSSFVYYPALQDVYGVPTMLMNMSMFYNERLLVAVTGSSRPPANHREYLALCEQIATYAQRTGEPLLPIAGSSDYGFYLMHLATQNLTQKLRAKIDFSRVLTASSAQIGMACLRGDWSLDSLEIQGGLAVFQTMGQGMQSGFLQLRREDAALYFTQQKAVMMLSGSWDYHFLAEECDFPLVVGRLPLPDPADPDYGGFTNGRPHEGEQMLSGIFGITRASPHRQEALDFLCYLTSHATSTRFSAITHTLSATRKITPADDHLKVFAPVENGPVNGFGPGLGAETNRWFATNAFRLFQPGATPPRFARETGAAYLKAVVADLRQVKQDQSKTNQRADTTLVAALHNRHAAPLKAAQLFTEQALRELEIAQLETVLNRR